MYEQVKMKRTASLLMVLVLVVGSFAAIPASGALASTPTGTAASGTQTTATSDGSTNESSASIAPGARFSGAVGVHGAELRGDVDARRFGIRIAKANTADAKAEIVAGQLNESQQRVEQLEQRLDELQQARQNGTISQGEYAVRAAQIHAKLNSVQHMANRSADVASGLPEETLRANGVNVSAIEQLRQRAANLSGPEVAVIARTIAGPNTGEHPGAAENRTDRPDGAVGVETGTDVATGVSVNVTNTGTQRDTRSVAEQVDNQTLGDQSNGTLPSTPDTLTD